MMRLTWTTLTLALGAVCLFTRGASGETFEACVSCLEKLPDTVECILDQDQCNLLECDLSPDPPFLVGCGCADCLEDVLVCLLGCLPTCLDDAVANYAGCLIDSDNGCFSSCAGYIGVGSVVTGPPLLPPEDCDIFNLFDDPTSCLPIWPSCEDVEDTVIAATCKATECCSPCQEFKLDMEECFYNWLASEDCKFDCPSSTATSRSINPRVTPQEVDFEDECRLKLASNIMLQPHVAFNDYMDCVLTNSLEFATDEANQPTDPPPQDTTTTSPPQDTTTTSPPQDTTTTDPPQDTTTEPPQDTTTEPPQDTTTEPPLETTTNPPQDAPTDPPVDEPSNPPGGATTEDANSGASVQFVVTLPIVIIAMFVHWM